VPPLWGRGIEESGSHAAAERTVLAYEDNSSNRWFHAAAAYQAILRRVTQIAPGIHRIGEDSRINSYLLEEGGEVTLIDAAMPGYYGDLPRELSAMGRTIDDLRAVVLTHGHADHVGFAEKLRRDRKVPVWIHELDRGYATGREKPKRTTGPQRITPLLAFIWLALRSGGLGLKRITQVSTFGDAATLDVPGAPRVVLVPGHTPGSAALYAQKHDALFVGDALATFAVTTGRHAPQIAPFTGEPAQALESLARLENLDASLVLPGHGDAWTQGISEAVRQIRATTGPSGFLEAPRT
jgi:glyoxylase-like metal-dependent hydrolase (beta-lactamase superfamily II)